MNKVEEMHSIQNGINLLELIKILRLRLNVKESSNIYSNNKDFAKQRYNTPYACNVI